MRFLSSREVQKNKFFLSPRYAIIEKGVIEPTDTYFLETLIWLEFFLNYKKSVNKNFPQTTNIEVRKHRYVLSKSCIVK